MAYNINFQALALWIGVAAVVGGGYFVVSSDSSQQTSFNIGMEEDTVPGELTRLSVESDGEPVDGANISIDGEYIGTTNSQGIKGFETPENNFTVEASKGDVSSETTFTVEDGSFSSPEEDSGDSSDDSNNSDGSDDESGDSSNEGDDSDDGDSDGSEEGTDNQDSSDDQQDSSEDSSDTVDDFTGLKLDENPLVGELRTLTVYEDGEEVSSAEVTVNGEVVGTTNAGGTITFGVPDSAEISVSTDTGLSETFTVEDYTQDEQNQTDDQNETEEDLTTGIQLDSDPVSGTTNRIILYDQGDRVSGETVYLGGNELGQTGSNGAIEFEVPLQEQITVSTDYDLEDQTFNVTEDHPEPDITLLSPDDGSTFDTVQGETTDIDFEASVEITENSGTASVMIDGSEAYTQELSSGANTISTTQALSGETHNWQVEVDTPEYNVSSSSRSLTVNEVEVENGLSLQSNATAGEYNYVRLYDSGEPVEGMEVTVNGDSIGTTDSNGEVGFEVPNTQEITVSASGYSDITRTVEGYTPESPVSRTTFDWTVETSDDFQTTLDLNGENRYSSSGSSNTNFQKELIIGDSGTHNLDIRVTQNGDTYYKNVSFSTTQDIPKPTLDQAIPTEGDSFQTYRPEIGASYSLGLAHDVEYIVDGNSIYSNNHPEGSSGYQVEQVVLAQGSHNLDIDIQYTNFTKSVDLLDNTFSTEETIPPGRIERIYPLDDYAGPGGEFKFNVTAYHDSTYRLVVENDTTRNVLTEGTIDSPDGKTNGKEVSITHSYPWEDNGDKEWYVEVEGGEMLETSEKLLLSNAGLE